MENSIIQYSYMKSVRFNLIDNNNQLMFIKKDEFSKSDQECINLNKFDKIIEDFKKFFFEYDNKDKKCKINKESNYILKKVIKIKKVWFKNYFKEGWDFKNNNEKSNKQTNDKISNLLSNFEEKLLILKRDLEIEKKKKHSKKRNSHFSLILQEILSKDSYYALKDLISNTINKNEDIKLLKDEFDDFENDLKYLSKEYLSSQSVGVEILRGSFNYYTINKNSKNYLNKINKKIDDLINDLKNNKILRIKDNKKIVIYKFKNIDNFVLGDLTNKDSEVIEKLKKELKIDFSLNIEDSKRFMKLFKGSLKSKLFEDLLKVNNFEEIKNYSVLFNDNEKLSKIKNLTNRIANSKNKEKIQELKRKRGGILNSFENWKKFINLYKKISQFYGNTYSKIIGYEKEKFDSKKINYWCLLNKESDKYYLLFVPKENRKEVRDLLKNKKTDFDGNVFQIKSLTKRALHKLCFNEYGSFFNEMEKKEPEIYERIKNFKKNFRRNFEKEKTKELISQANKLIKKDNIFLNNEKFISLNKSKNFDNFIKHFKKGVLEKYKELFESKINEFNEEYTYKKEQETIDILKKVLKSNYTLNRLDLEDFDLKNSKVFEAKTLKEFEEELEKRCYKVIKSKLNEELIKKLENDFGVIRCEINSYDLDKRYLDKNETPFESSEKRHTKDYWNEFWRNLENASVRLNPEVRVNFKEKDPTLKHYLICKKNVTEDKINNSHYSYNRNLEDKFIIMFSFLKNPGKKYLDMGFSDFEENKKHIEDFNKEINEKLKENAFYCGIDIGEVELASLAVFKFNKNRKIDETGVLYPILPSSSKIKCLRLKKDYLTKYEMPSSSKLNYNNIIRKFDEVKEKQIISNLSYFDDREDFFEEISPFGLDLSCAKVINGKIIENGDVLTYLQYLKKLAKRRLFKIKSNNEFPYFNDFYLDWEFEKNLEYKTNNLVLKYKGEKIKNKDGKVSELAKIFTFFYQFEGIKTKNGVYKFDLMKSYFNKYLEDLKNIKDINNDEYLEKTISVPMINNLRDGLVANIIGVLSLLKEKLGNCYIVLENEEKKNQDDKYIIKRLELALYQKFQTYGLIPPNIKDLMIFREKSYKDNNNSYIQIGNIIFVNSSKTSKLCPYCGKEEKEFNHYKGNYICSNCCFKTNKNSKLDEFKVLKSNDIVASYNIAKKGFENINNL